MLILKLLLCLLVFIGAVAPATAQPTIAAHNGGGDAALTTSRSVPMPSGIQAGDLLVIHACVMAVGANPAPDISGWTIVTVQSATAPSYIIATKIAAGGDTATLTSKSAMAAYSSFRVTGFHTQSGVSAYELSSVASNSSTESIDHPSLDPTGWATENTKWLPVLFKGDNQAVTDPSGYTRVRHDIVTGGTGGTQCAVVTSEKNANTASDDPGTSSWVGLEPAFAYTAGIRPAAAGGGNCFGGIIGGGIIRGRTGC